MFYNIYIFLRIRDTSLRLLDTLKIQAKSLIVSTSMFKLYNDREFIIIMIRH